MASPQSSPRTGTPRDFLHAVSTPFLDPANLLLFHTFASDVQMLKIIVCWPNSNEHPARFKFPSSGSLYSGRLARPPHGSSLRGPANLPQARAPSVVSTREVPSPALGSPGQRTRGADTGEENAQTLRHPEDIHVTDTARVRRTTPYGGTLGCENFGGKIKPNSFS